MMESCIREAQVKMAGGNIAAGADMALGAQRLGAGMGIYRQSELGNISAAGMARGTQYPDQPQFREVEQVLVDLNQVIERLCKAVAAINDRTKAVQDPREPEGKLAGGQVRGYSSSLAQGLSMNAFTLEEQCKKLEELDRRIQL